MDELLKRLAVSMGQASEAIGARDLPQFLQALYLQQSGLDRITADRASAALALKQRPDIAHDLAFASALLSRILCRSSRSLWALSSASRSADPLYSLETLPRR